MRPGTLSTIKPNLSRKKSSATGGDSNKIQTTLNFERIPRKSSEQMAIKPSAQEQRDKVAKPFPSPKEEAKIASQPKTPVIPKPQVQKQIVENPKSNSTSKSSEPRKLARTTNRSQTSLVSKLDFEDDGKNILQHDHYYLFIFVIILSYSAY